MTPQSKKSKLIRVGKNAEIDKRVENAKRNIVTRDRAKKLLKEQRLSLTRPLVVGAGKERRMNKKVLKRVVKSLKHKGE